MLTIACPSCRKKIHPPEHLAGRRVMCPRCETVIVVPTELVRVMEEASPPVEGSSPNADPPFPLAARLGIIALVLAMMSLFLLCAPIASYLGIGLSGLGLLLGLVGMFRARTDSEQLPPSISGGVGIYAGFGTRVRDYPLAGVAASLLALFLTLLPTLSQWVSEQWS